MTVLRISWYDDEGEQLRLDVEEKCMKHPVVLSREMRREKIDTKTVDSYGPETLVCGIVGLRC
ncbi:hypothetical protein P692DRAFT_20838837 [Suillus brevipes Sb2]|nr:hypothetical protein P692DRAFT_20838837 [Suillus brevipes Sb2]